MFVSVVFGAEIFYRDKFYKNQHDNNEPGAPNVYVETNKKYNEAMTSLSEKLTSFCNKKLANQPKTKENCDQYMEENSKYEPVLIADGDFNLRSLARSDGMNYSSFIKNKEIGGRIELLGDIGTPYVFAILFSAIGFCASSLGGLIDRDNIENYDRLANLVMGPICSSLCGLALFYIFIPEDVDQQQFARRLFNVPISVYILSFIFSVRPTESFKNIVEFASNQLQTFGRK